jgi:hypothetical protein
MGERVIYKLRSGFRTAACLVVGVAFGVCIVGCAPSTAQIVNMRKETWAWKAKENCQTLLKCLQDESVPPHNAAAAAWRIEALRTLHHIDRLFGYVAVEPQLHGEMLDATGNEYHRPGSAGERDKLRAWAICLLGRTTQRPPPSYFVEVILENSPSKDPDHVVFLAALGALSLQMDALAADPILRRKMLYRLAQASSDIERGRIGTRRMKDVSGAVNGFEQRLKSYASIVDLLRANASGRDVAAMLEILKWNYQQLKIGAHRSPAGRGDELFAQNTDVLLLLAWHGDAFVRSRSRLILAEFAPGALFDAVTQRVSGQTAMAPEDYRQLAAMMVKLTGADYRPRRSKAIAALFTAQPNIPLCQREVVYGKLLSHFPGDLRDGLLAASGSVLKESERSALQHLRYLEHLRGDKGVDGKIDAAVAMFMRHHALAVRTQVVASLSGRNPVLLARCCVPAIKAMSRVSAGSAKYLVDAYMSTLAVLESADRLKGLKQAMGSQDPYELLSHGVSRLEYGVTAGIAAFLCRRDCDLLVGMLSRNCSRTADLRLWCLLGDIVQKYNKKLTKQSLASASTVFAGGLSSRDPERAILCARYLLELGHDLGNIAGGNAGAAGAMSDLAKARAVKASKSK